LLAAGLFAVCPLTVYLGRRVMQETLGLTAILVAVVLASVFLRNGSRRVAFVVGFALGLAMAVKYVFVPAALGIVLALAVASDEHLRSAIRRIGRPSFWGLYACLCLALWSTVLALQGALGLPIHVPLIDPMYVSLSDVSVVLLVFVVPLLASLLLTGALSSGWLRDSALPALKNLCRNRGLRFSVLGLVAGFLVVIGPFLLRFPGEYLTQTVLFQSARPATEFPSLLGVARIARWMSSFMFLAYLPTLAVVPVAFVLLARRPPSPNRFFLAVALLAALAICQFLPSAPRYNISLYPLLFLALALVVSEISLPRMRGGARIRTAAAVALLLLPACTSLTLLKNYTGYDVGWAWPPSDEEEVYTATVEYLEQADARKVYAPNPICIALAEEIDTVLSFNTYANLWLRDAAAPEFVDGLVDEGVEYFLLDAWSRNWPGSYQGRLDELVAHLRARSHLVEVIGEDSVCWVEVYSVARPGPHIVDGDFSWWPGATTVNAPLGWNPVIVSEPGSDAAVRQSTVCGKGCVEFAVCQQSTSEPQTTHAGLSQMVSFPQGGVVASAFLEANSIVTDTTVLGPAIHFVDSNGHAVSIGFDASLTSETVRVAESGESVVVLKPGFMHEWHDYELDVARYWGVAGWLEPESVTMLIVASASDTGPSCFRFGVSRVANLEGEK